MIYQVIFLLICKQIYSLGYFEDNVCIPRPGFYVCCYNYELRNGNCTECQSGTTTYDVGGRCRPCKKDRYGYKCLQDCVCDHFERRRQSSKVRITNEEVILEPVEPSPYIGIYDEVDQNESIFNTTDLNVLSQEPHYETIDVVPQEILSITTRSGHGDTGYLDPYVAMEDGIQQLKDERESTSTNSSSSNVMGQDKTAYHNLYQSLQDNWQDDTHGYEVTVTVHQCNESSSGLNRDTTSNAYSNVCQPRQKDCCMKSHTYENQESLKAVNDKRLHAACPSVYIPDNLHGYINTYAESDEIIDSCNGIEHCKLFDKDKSKTIEQKSGDFDFRKESINECNTSYSQNDHTNMLNPYDDAKSCI
ncbi:unnamed protein product [Mytilus coruscus]|uniref:MEGF10_11 n=1 Tax=Mytilus coruscus TaxID=42192 RepID=A0A6J8ATJ8_MYTCO|nr:unnamed protein product [Mytilus coruscus]